MPPRVSKGKITVIAITSTALMPFGCSDREDRSRPDYRAPTATNSAKAQQSAQTNTPAGQCELTDAEVFATAYTNTAAVGNKGYEWLEPALNPKQIAELKAKAEKGDAQAQFELGANFRQTEVYEAMKCILKAAQQDHKHACFHAGNYFSMNSARYLTCPVSQPQERASLRWDGQTPEAIRLKHRSNRRPAFPVSPALFQFDLPGR